MEKSALFGLIHLDDHSATPKYQQLANSLITAVQSGRLRALGITSLKRSPAAPEIPTFSETIPKFESIVWYGLLAPAGTPRAVVQRLNTEIVRILRTPEAIERINSFGLEPTTSTPEELGAHVKSEMTRWADVVKRYNIKAE